MQILPKPNSQGCLLRTRHDAGGIRAQAQAADAEEAAGEAGHAQEGAGLRQGQHPEKAAERKDADAQEEDALPEGRDTLEEPRGSERASVSAEGRSAANVEADQDKGSLDAEKTPSGRSRNSRTPACLPTQGHGNSATREGRKRHF